MAFDLETVISFSEGGDLSFSGSGSLGGSFLGLALLEQQPMVAQLKTKNPRVGVLFVLFSGMFSCRSNS